MSQSGTASTARAPLCDTVTLMSGPEALIQVAKPEVFSQAPSVDLQSRTAWPVPDLDPPLTLCCLPGAQVTQPSGLGARIELPFPLASLKREEGTSAAEEDGWAAGWDYGES